MAVSHQWFIQWSPPSMIYADITSQYKKVNERFNTFKHEPTYPWEVNTFRNSDANKLRNVQDPLRTGDNGFGSKRKEKNGK